MARNRNGPITYALLIKHGLPFASKRGLAGVSIAPLAERSGVASAIPGCRRIMLRMRVK